MQMVLLLPKSHSVLQKSITIFISVFILHIHARMDKHADIQKQQGIFLEHLKNGYHRASCISQPMKHFWKDCMLFCFFSWLSDILPGETMLHQDQTRRGFTFLPVSFHCSAHLEKELPPLVAPEVGRRAALYCITVKSTQ